MDSLRNRRDLSVRNKSNADSKNDIHYHVIKTIDVMKAVKKLKQDKVNEDDLLLSENCINDSDLLFVYVS